MLFDIETDVYRRFIRSEFHILRDMERMRLTVGGAGQLPVAVE